MRRVDVYLSQVVVCLLLRSCRLKGFLKVLGKVFYLLVEGLNHDMGYYEVVVRLWRFGVSSLDLLAY